MDGDYQCGADSRMHHPQRTDSEQLRGAPIVFTVLRRKAHRQFMSVRHLLSHVDSLNMRFY